MRDLVDLSYKSYEQIGKKIAKSNINLLVTVGKTASIIAKSAEESNFKGSILTLQTTDEAIKQLKKIANKNTVFLVKGSRHEHLERIVSGLLHKSTHINCYHCGELK